MIARHLEWQCNKEGYSTMHLPASIACATIGGFLAHRGTGVLSTKYGKIEDMVMSLQVVKPTGEIIRTLPVPRHASGPDLTMLFLGSEGTLGIITEVTLKVHPQPEAREFRAYIFKDFHTAMSAGVSSPARCVFMMRRRPSTMSGRCSAWSWTRERTSCSGSTDAKTLSPAR